MEGDGYQKSLRQHEGMMRSRGSVTKEYSCFAEENFAVVDAFPLWVLVVIEKLVACSTFLTLKNMFTKSVNDEVEHDDSRQMYSCEKNWVLWFLIVSPLTRALLPHGFLDVRYSKRRLAKVVTYIQSSGKANSSKQGWHTDFPSTIASYFGDHFPISVLVAGFQDSYVDIVPGTYGHESDEELEDSEIRRARTIKLKRGQALVMGPGLRHRGLAYTSKNVRFFAAFLFGRSSGASIESTYNLENVVNS